MLPRLECDAAISAHHNLRLLTSGDPPASTSQSAGIIGVSHCAQLAFLNIRFFFPEVRSTEVKFLYKCGMNTFTAL